MFEYDQDAERAFLSSYDSKLHERALSSVDVVLLTVFNGRLRVLLTHRSEHPQRGKWSLPGVNIRPDIDGRLDDVARRATKEKTGLDDIMRFLEQLKTYGGPERDPRGWSMTTAYFGLIPFQENPYASLRGVEQTKWFDVDDVPGMPIAFDHKEIIADAVERLRNKVGYSLIAVDLLADEFTIPDLQKMHETILGIKLDKSGFRKRIEIAGELEPIKGKTRQEGMGAPAQLFRKKEGSSTTTFKRSLKD